MTQTPEKTLLSIEEANSRLPLVRAIVRDITALFQDVHERRDRLAKLRLRSSKTDGHDDPYAMEVRNMEEEVERDIERLRGYQAELTATDAQMQDPVSGIVTFPGELDGREVAWSWKLGEPEIGFWHEPDQTFADRQALLETCSPQDNERPDQP